MASQAGIPTDTPSTLRTLQTAVKGLRFMSEADKPVKAFVWEDGSSAADAVAALCAAKGVDKSKVKTLPVSEFFTPMTEVKDWMGDEEKSTAAKFAALVDTLGKTLTGAQALRVEGGGGDASPIDAYVVGKDAVGHWAGVSTQLVET